MVMFILLDVIDKDTDTQCKTLAVQALVLLENIIKQVLYEPLQNRSRPCDISHQHGPRSACASKQSDQGPCIQAVWSGSMLFTERIFCPQIMLSICVDSDQTVWKLRRIWVYKGCLKRIAYFDREHSKCTKSQISLFHALKVVPMTRNA